MPILLLFSTKKVLKSKVEGFVKFRWYAWCFSSFFPVIFWKPENNSPKNVKITLDKFNEIIKK